VLFFGLGTCTAVDEITVRWPDAQSTTESFKHVGTSRMIELRQGDHVVHDVQL
jgi:hypothetical protein